MFLFVAAIHCKQSKYVEECITKSLKDLQLSYVDLYLIHNPVGFVYGEGVFPKDENGKFKLDMSTDLVALWKVKTV